MLSLKGDCKISCDARSADLLQCDGWASCVCPPDVFNTLIQCAKCDPFVLNEGSGDTLPLAKYIESALPRCIAAGYDIKSSGDIAYPIIVSDSAPSPSSPASSSASAGVHALKVGSSNATAASAATDPVRAEAQEGQVQATHLATTEVQHTSDAVMNKVVGTASGVFFVFVVCAFCAFFTAVGL